jgi:hypothetical protein
MTEKAQQIDLGLALLAILRKPGQTFTREDISAWADCSPQAIFDIERKALRKARRALKKAGIILETPEAPSILGPLAAAALER